MGWRDGSNYPTKLFLKDLWFSVSGYRRKLGWWYVVRLLSQSLSLIPPIILARIIDSLASQSQTLREVVGLVIVSFVVQMSRSFINNRSKYQVNYLAERIRLSVRQKSIAKLIAFDLSWHENNASGKKIAVIAKGADSLNNLVRFVTKGSGGVDMVINIGAVLVIFVGLHPKYCLIGLINAVTYLGILFWLNGKINRRRHQVNKDYERVIGKNFDYFSNMNLIKSLGIGKQINNHLFRKELGYTNRSIRFVRASFDKWVYINLISQLFNALMIGMVVIDIYTGRISVGSFFIFSGYINRLQDGLGDIAEWADNLLDYKMGFWRMVQLLKSGVSRTSGGSKEFPEKFSSMNFDQISFTYSGAKTPVLNKVNFEIPQGSRVGLVGESGSGKTTVTKLLLRLYLLTEGQIRFDKLDVRDIAADELSRHIAVVPQESEVFNLTFRENITIASDRRVFDQALYNLALKVSCCQPILDKIKNNHRTLLGEKGVKLSGGERQRLGIARAIYKDSPVIIFDESTSALDSKTEEAILVNLEKYLSQKTILWVAHRLSTLRFTNRIIVFNQGRIIEDGNFEALIGQKGHFYQLWNIQKQTRMNIVK